MTHAQQTSVSIGDMAYITTLYFILGIIISIACNQLFGPWNRQRDSTLSLFMLAVELIIMIWIYGVITYVVRLIIIYIPSPFSYVRFQNPEYQFNHLEMKELTSAAVFTLILLGTSYHFKSKLDYFYRRLTRDPILESPHPLPTPDMVDGDDISAE